MQCMKKHQETSKTDGRPISQVFCFLKQNTTNMEKYLIVGNRRRWKEASPVSLL